MGADAIPSWVVGNTVSMRIVRDPEGGELRSAPAEGDELDDEDREYTDEGYR